MKAAANFLGTQRRSARMLQPGKGYLDIRGVSATAYAVVSHVSDNPEPHKVATQLLSASALFVGALNHSILI